MDFEKCNIKDCDFNYNGKCSQSGYGNIKTNNQQECDSFEPYDETWEGNQ